MSENEMPALLFSGITLVSPFMVAMGWEYARAALKAHNWSAAALYGLWWLTGVFVQLCAVALVYVALIGLLAR